MKPPYQTASAVKINKVVKLALALYCCSTPKWGTTRKGKGNPHTEISSPAKARKKYKKRKWKENEKKDEENSEITTIVTALAVFPSSKRRQQETKRDKQMTELKQEERREREISYFRSRTTFHIFPYFPVFLCFFPIWPEVDTSFPFHHHHYHQRFLFPLPYSLLFWICLFQNIKNDSTYEVEEWEKKCQGSTNVIQCIIGVAQGVLPSSCHGWKSGVMDDYQWTFLYM